MNTKNYYTKKDIIGSTLRFWRNRAVLKHVYGSLLDVACGDNTLIKAYGSGVGVDVEDFGADLVLKNFYSMPMEDKSFDTIAIVASLNYFEDPVRVLREIRRVLKDDGKLVLTMSNDKIMKYWHKFREKWAHSSGYSREKVVEILLEADFTISEEHSFMFYANRIYVASKK